MERAMLGRFWICLTLLALALQVCLASVTVKMTPKVEVLKGDTVRLPCNYTISAPSSTIVVIWFIENTDGSRKQVAYKSSPVSDAGTTIDRYTMEKDMSLSISPVMVDDHKKFICQVTAGVVGTSENVSQVHVFSAPETPIAIGTNQAIAVGQGLPSAEVGKCISKFGHPEPRIIWFKNDNPLPEEKKTTESTYMIPSLVKEASGLYTMTSTLHMQLGKADAKSVFHCTVEYSMPNNQIKQESSNKFNLTLLYSTENVSFKVKNKGPIKEGDDVEMECETDGNPQPEFEFSKKDKPLKGSKGILKVKNVTRKDAGVYICEALDFDAEDVELTKTLNLTVHYIDPVALTPEGPLVASKGDAVELQCKTKSSDSHTLHWKKDSKVLSNTGALTIQPVTLAESGVYTCVGAVPSVPDLQKQASVTLSVKGQPEIGDSVNGLVENEGGIVSLNCSALGFPAPQFTWTPSGKESVTVVGNRVISTVTLEATSAVLKDGVICEAYNSLGRDSRIFKVSIKDQDKPQDSGNRVEKQQGGSSLVVIAVVVCVLLLLILVALLFFLNKNGKLSCGKKDKDVSPSNEMTKPSQKGHEEAGLLNKPAEQC